MSNMPTPPEYPDAVAAWIDGHSQPGTLADKNTIVLHETEGASAAGAISTFRQSVAPHRVSCHFVIDRDGTVFQCINIADVAWHASQVNAHSVGIEHAGISATGAKAISQSHALMNPPLPPVAAMPCTDAQYAASSKLVAWLCHKLQIPCDRTHVREHCEASPADHHDLCCHGALDPNRVVAMAKVVQV
jgi:N-acetyl-anhydromuramyl-L-alanine amidase AmpD